MKWISVKDKLPDFGIQNKVMVNIEVIIDPDGVLKDPKKKILNCITAAYYCCSSGWIFDQPKYNDQYPFSQTITHWLKIPKVPDEN